MQEQYNFKGIFKSRDNDSKPSFLRDVVRLHTHNSMESNKAFILDREDQFEGFFSRNFQDQIEQRSIELLYDNRERLTREAVFEHANYSFTSRLLNNANGVMGRMFASFETPNLFDSDTESEKFGRETLHEFLNILKESNVDEARNNRIKESVAPKPIAEMNYKFDNYINNNIANAENASRHINKDIRDFKHRVTAQGSVIDYFTNKGYSRSIKLMDNIDYINRPGILPAVGMIHDAESELSINIFQLQNKPIIDYLTADLVSRAEEIRKQREAGATVKNFTFRLQLAWNKELANDAASYNILGPNLTAIRTFQNLAAKYADALDITIQTLDRRNHTKLIFSDQGAYISTQNQTAPVGKSLYQAGSNYESGRYVRNLQITPNSTVSERSEAKLYQQVKELQTTMFRQKLLQTNQPNISGPVETYEMMKSSLNYLQKNKDTGVKIDFILDQVFLLQYDSMLFDKVAEGEMGPESKGTLKKVITDLDNKKTRYRTDIQEPLMLALIEGKAHVTTDVRNFKQKVQEPIYTELMKLDSFKDSGYNLETFLNDDISLSTEQRINRVTAKVGSRDRAIQLLAIASGNIQTANVPRQHVKASLLYRTSANGIEGIAGELSSSNRGLYSMSLIDNDFERDMTNNELGMMFYSEDFARELNINKESAYSLEGNEVTEELQEYTKHYISMKSDLSTRRVGQLEYSNVNNRAEWEKDVDRKKLVNLFNSLTEMNKSTGGDAMKISYDYNNKGPISILVDLNNGLKYRFTALQGGVNNQGFIYEINKSKVIGESDFINQSSESIRTSFTDNGNPIFIGSKERLTLTPIQTTMSMISSISLEASQIRLIRAPLIEYQTHYAPGAEGSDNFDAGIARYLLALSGYSDRGVTDVLNIDQGSIIKGALENLHLRMKNSDATLDKVRQFAGIDINSEDRQAKLQYLTDLIQVFGNVNENDRRLLITGEGLEGRQSLKRFMSFLFSSPEYADVLYDFIQSQGDPLYQQATNKYVKEVSSRVFDPYLNRTQVSVYGSTQAFRQRPLYGINNRRAAFGRGVNNAALSNLQGMFRLGGYALAASPFDHDATADFGTDFKDGSLLFIQITGTGGSREKSGLEYSGYNEYDNLLPYYQHKKIGTATGLEIIQDAGVGSIIDKQSVADYNDAIAHLNLTVDSENLLQGNDRMLLFNFDVKKKASQIPQRIKNVIGSRPTMELTTNLQELIESKDNKTTFEGQDINNIEALRAAYLEDLRSKVAKGIGRKKADSLITDMYAVGIEFGGQIRATLSNDVAEVLESIRKDINTEFEGVDEDTKAEILRVRLLNADLSAHSVRGFIGSSKREGRNSFVLFQLSGAYSDYSFLNPEFGSTDTLDGMRTGFADRAVKGHQASKLSSQRLLGKKGDFNLADELLIQSGSYIKRDKDTGLFHVFSFDETEQKYVRGQAVSSRKEFTIVRNLLEAVKAEPSIGKLGTVSNAASFEGEMAIEILRDVRILEGEVTSNEIRTEIDYIRTGRRGGSARQESLSGGLAKMVPIFLYDPANKEDGTPQKGLLRQMFEQFEQTSGKVGSFGGESDLSYSQFYGVVNPSNLKSYFYEHGAQILIDNNKKTALLGTDGKTLAAALVMSFGTSRFASGDRIGVLDELAKFAASGDLGHFYQDQYLLGFLQHRGDTTKVAEGFVKSMEGISNLQVRALEYIGLDLIKNALTGDTNAASEIQKRVTDLLTDTTGVVGREYLNTGKDRGKEMAIIAASLDYFVQLTQAKANDIAVVNTTRDRSAYLSLGTIGGMSYEELVEKENKGLSQLVNQLGRTSYTVGMWMSLSGSQSKVAISSKLESFIETQHTIFEPFYTNLTKFQKGGSLDSLRQLMAGFYGAMAGTHTGEFINAMSGLQQINLLDTRNPIFASRMVGYLNDPFTSDAEFKEYQRNYEMFGVLQSLVSNETSEFINADLVKKVIETYRKDAKNLDLNPDTLNTELNNLINAAEDNDLGRVQEIISQGYEYSLYHFERMYADFRLNPNKGDANAGQAISTGVQRSAGATGRFAFTLPVMEFNEGTIRVDKRSLQRSFSLAGEDLKIIGESFGNVDAPILKSQAILWQAFSPNSAVSRLLDRINDDKPISEVDVSLEDYEEIMRFYTTAINMPVEITEAIGVYGNKILGNKIGFAGGTTTPAAWFMGGTQMSILPEIIMERHGAGTNNRRDAHQYVISKLKDSNELLNIKSKIKEKLSNINNSIQENIEKQSEIYKTWKMSFENKDYTYNELYDNKYEWEALKSEQNKLLDILNTKFTQLTEERDERLQTRYQLEGKLELEISNLQLKLNALYESKKHIEANTNIKELEKHLYYLKTEKYRVNLEIKNLKIERTRILTHRNYIEQVLTNKAEWNEKLGNFNRANLLSISERMKREIDNLNSQINNLYNYKDSIPTGTLSEHLPLEYPTIKREYVKLSNQSGYSKINSAIDIIQEDISQLNLLLRSNRESYFFENLVLEIKEYNNQIDNINTEKQEEIKIKTQITEELKKLEEFIKIYESLGFISRNRTEISNLNQKKDRLLSLLQETNEKNQETKPKQYLTYLARTLNKGISAAATSELNLLIEKSREFQERLQLASNNESELTKLIEDIEGTKESKYSITYYERNLQVSINEKGKERFGVNLNEGGDPFVDLLGLYELRTIRAAAISQGGTSNRLSNEAQKDSVQFAEDMKKLYSPFTGLVIGSEVDDYTNLPKVTPEEMALEMRRGASKLEKALGLNFDSISNLEKTTGKIYFERVISNIENFANERIAELQNRYDSKVNGELAEGTINRLRNMIRDVRAYENRLSDDMSKHDVRDIALLLTGEVEKYHAEINLGITQSMRPAPMGGSYMGRAVYDTFGLGDVNRLMRSWELPISFTPGGQEDVDHRNKTLHLFNPYSWLVSHLGDFDGDMITNMFRTTSQLDLRVRTYDASIAAAQEELILLGNKIKVTIPDTEEYTKLNKLKSDTEDRIGNLEKQKAEFSRLSQQAKDNTTYREYQIAAAKWVGNYLKVDYRMFLDDKHGGYRLESQGNVPPEVLFTYTEQGRGLFGGMEAIVTKSMDLFYDFRQLAENKLTLDTWENVHNRLDNLSDSGLKELIQKGNLPNELKEEIIRLSSNYEDDPLVRDAQIAEYVARLYSSQSGLESLQKYNLKGIDGSAMTPDIFMAMENTLGQAGSVVLGKSYNTMVGMLYTESPNLALSYALLNDPDDKLKTIVVEAYTSQGMNGAAKYNEMKEAAQHSFLKSQQMGEFLQATQQILRDSIKPKDAALFIKELEEALLKYRGESDVEKKQEAYTEIVNKFGPGKGLKALIQMESLVQDLTILNRQIKDDNKDLQLQKTLEKYELTDTKKEELLKRLGYDETTGEYDVFRERDAQGNVIGKEFNRQIAAAQLSKEYIVAAYKTKQDMVSVVSDFAYTKGLNEGESTGRSMLSSFKENFNKFDATEQARITKLVQAADSYFTGGADLVGLQDAESQAFVEALMDRGNLGPNDYHSMNYKDTKWNKAAKITNNLERQQYEQSEDYYKKLYEAHVYATTSDAFGKTVGDYGEMFIRFAQFNQARRDVYSNNHWRDTATGFDILSDPLAMAEMLGMVSGKVTPEFIGKAMRNVTNAVRQKTGEANPSLESIINVFLQGTSMSETPQDTQMKRMWAFVESNNKTATELLMQTVQSMALGQMSATAKEFIQRGQFDNQENLTQAVLKEHFSKMGFNEDESYLLASRATMRITQGAVAQVEAKKMMDRNQMVNVIGSLGKDADVKAQSFIFPALGLIGAALASGDLSPEAFQVAAGTALTNLSYVRWNNLQDNFKRTAMNMIGGGAFKMRLALQENEGDAGKAIVTMATRELIMGSTAAIVNKYGTEYINKALGGIKTLDFDRFESARNVATSTMTAVASTLLGMMLGNGVLAAGKIINNEINESEQTVRKINQSIQQKVFNQAAVEEEEELAVEGDGEFLEYKTVHNWGEESDVDYTTDEWSINEEFNYAFNNTPVGMYAFEIT